MQDRCEADTKWPEGCTAYGYSTGRLGDYDPRSEGVAGCPHSPSGRGRDSGGCCLFKSDPDGWCGENYWPGYVCENNACGSDDCCVPPIRWPRGECMDDPQGIVPVAGTC